MEISQDLEIMYAWSINRPQLGEKEGSKTLINRQWKVKLQLDTK